MLGLILYIQSKGMSGGKGLLDIPSPDFAHALMVLVPGQVLTLGLQCDYAQLRFTIFKQALAAYNPPFMYTQ